MADEDLETLLEIARNLVLTIYLTHHPYRPVRGSAPDLYDILGLCQGMAKGHLTRPSSLEIIIRFRNALEHPSKCPKPSIPELRGAFHSLVDWIRELNQTYEIPADNLIQAKVALLAIGSYARKTQEKSDHKQLVEVPLKAPQWSPTWEFKVPDWFKWDIDIITTPKEIVDNQELRQRQFLLLTGSHAGLFLFLKSANGTRVNVVDHEGISYRIRSTESIAFF